MTDCSEEAFRHDPGQRDVRDHDLCDLLLQIAGRDTNRRPSAVRHVAVLDAAIPYMTQSQASIARARITGLETRWGRLLPGASDMAETDAIPPEVLMHRWLSQRTYPERYPLILHQAAKAVLAGETRLSVIQDHAYRGEVDGLLAVTTLTSFGEWLRQLRIAVRDVPTVYLPGRCCEWWANEMNPQIGKEGSYAACMKRLRQPQWNGTP